MGKGPLKITDKISDDDFEDAIVTILKQVRPRHGVNGAGASVIEGCHLICSARKAKVTSLWLRGKMQSEVKWSRIPSHWFVISVRIFRITFMHRSDRVERLLLSKLLSLRFAVRSQHGISVPNSRLGAHCAIARPDGTQRNRQRRGRAADVLCAADERG